MPYIYCKCSAVAQTGDHLATIDIGQKEGEGCCADFTGGTGTSSNAMWPELSLPLYQVASWFIRPFGSNTWAENWEAVPLWRELGPHLPQCCLGRGLLPHHVASCSIQPFGWMEQAKKFGAAVPLWGGRGSSSNTISPATWYGGRPRPTSVPSGWLVGWGLTALLTQNRSYRACRFVGIFYSKL